MPEYNIVDKLKAKSGELGFLECAIVPAGFLPEEEDRFRTWLNKGMQGEMEYMTRNFDKRLDPRLLVKNAKTIIVVLQNYYTSKVQVDQEAPVLSKYAFGSDYHVVMRARLKQLLLFIQKEITPCSGRPFVDSAPVLERAWGRHAGFGWIGKNSSLISAAHGSFFFIGELVIDTELPYDLCSEAKDRCGSCTRCMDACPTKAIVSPRVVDARRCISYQTIEMKGDLDEKLKGKFANRFFGCDICQDVCPWNRKAREHNEAAFYPSPALLNLTAEGWQTMDHSLFDTLFSDSPVQRIGYDRMKRNIGFLHNKQYKFTGELFQGPRGGYYIDFPFDVEKEFGLKKQVKVKVWFDGHPERKSLLPKGDGTHWLSVAMDIRMAIGKSDGDSIDVVVEADLEPRTVDLPEDLEWLLDDDPGMKQIFTSQSYYTQKFFTEWIGQTHDPDIRVKRINRIFEWLSQRRSGKAPSSLLKDESGE